MPPISVWCRAALTEIAHFGCHAEISAHLLRLPINVVCLNARITMTVTSLGGTRSVRYTDVLLLDLIGTSIDESVSDTDKIHIFDNNT
jgi:hypothetical protein